MSRKNIDQIERQYPEKRIMELYEQGRNRIEPHLKELVSRHAGNPDMLKSRWDDVRQLIFHIDGRVQYWENRRTQYLQFAAGILVATIAALVSVLNIILDADNWLETLMLFLPVLVPSLVLLFSSVRLVIIWNRQNNPSYPFTKGYRTWRWHYRHAEDHPLDTETSRYTVESFAQQVEYFTENLYLFKERMLSADIGELFDQDLSQLFLLLTNEKFKIKFVSELRDSLVASLTVALWLSICSLFVTLGYFGFSSGFIGNLVDHLGNLFQSLRPLPQPTPTPTP